MSVELGVAIGPTIIEELRQESDVSEREWQAYAEKKGYVAKPGQQVQFKDGMFADDNLEGLSVYIDGIQKGKGTILEIGRDADRKHLSCTVYQRDKTGRPIWLKDHFRTFKTFTGSTVVQSEHVNDQLIQLTHRNNAVLFNPDDADGITHRVKIHLTSQISGDSKPSSETQWEINRIRFKFAQPPSQEE